MALKEDPTITYAKVGGPPADYLMVVVVDDVTNQVVENAVEVNTKEGWVVVSVPNIIKSNGNKDKFVLEKRFGEFIICRKELDS